MRLCAGSRPWVSCPTSRQQANQEGLGITGYGEATVGDAEAVSVRPNT